MSVDYADILLQVRIREIINYLCRWSWHISGATVIILARLHCHRTDRVDRDAGSGLGDRQAEFMGRSIIPVETGLWASWKTRIHK